VSGIAEGYVPGVTTPEAAGHFMALIRFRRTSNPRWEIENGQRIRVSDIEPPQGKPLAAAFTDPAAALDSLEQCKARLLSEGWHEVPFDPVNDPD
jgi:hypothetical protein